MLTGWRESLGPVPAPGSFSYRSGCGSQLQLLGLSAIGHDPCQGDNELYLEMYARPQFNAFLPNNSLGHGVSSTSIALWLRHWSYTRAQESSCYG